MISSSNRISRREEVKELFEQLGQVLEHRVEVLLIGGAVMLELGLKDSIEDIFIMKMIANRPGDAPDCSALVIAELDFDVIYQEVEAQFRKAGEREQKIWITYIEEGVARLEDITRKLLMNDSFIAAS